MNKIIHYKTTDGKRVLTNPIDKEDCDNEIVAHYYKDGVGTIVFEKELTIIPKALFRGAWTLKEVVIPKSVRMIENNAFEKCKHLKIVILQNGLLGIGERAFAYTEIKEVVIPSSVIVICKFAFSHCPNLKLVDFHIPYSACIVGDHCFHASPMHTLHTTENHIFSPTAFDPIQL